MRERFSYILCVIFMLFGTSQIVYAAAAAADLLEEAAGKAASGLKDVLDLGGAEAEQAAAKESLINAIKDSSLAAGRSIRDAGGSEASAEAAVKASADAQVEKILSIARTDPETLRAGTLPREVTAAGTQAAQAAQDAAAALKFRRPLNIVRTSEPELPRLNFGQNVEALGKKALGVVTEGFSAVGGAVDKATPQTIKNGLKEVQDFFGRQAEGVGSSTSVKYALGKPKIGPDTIEITGRGTSATEKTAAQLKKIKRDLSDVALGSDDEPEGIFEDTLYDSKTGKPIENLNPAPKGLGKYARASDPAYPRNADGSFKQVLKKGPNGEMKFDEKGQVQYEFEADGKTPKFEPAPSKTVPGKPIIGKDGKPEIYTLDDVIGNRPWTKWVLTKGYGLAKGSLVKVLTVLEQGLVMGVAMSIPNQLMSSFMQEKQQQAALVTLAAPISFGGVVMQIPASCINTTNPAASLKMYVGVPVVDTSNPLSGTKWGGGIEATAGNPVVGPDEKEEISSFIASLANDQFKAFMSTLMSGSNEMQGSAGSSNVSRYTFYNGDNNKASWYDQAHFFCSYSPQSYIPWGSSAITDQGFPNFMIDLNTGYVFAKDGTTGGNVSAALLNANASATNTVQTFLSNYASQLESAGMVFDFAEYTSGGQPSVDTHTNGSLARQFSSACIVNKPTDKPAGGNNSGFGDPCMVGATRNSLLATSLVRLASGTCIGIDGKEITLSGPAVPEFAPGEIKPISGTQTVDQSSWLEWAQNNANEAIGWIDWGKGAKWALGAAAADETTAVKVPAILATSVLEEYGSQVGSGTKPTLGDIISQAPGKADKNTLLKSLSSVALQALNLPKGVSAPAPVSTSPSAPTAAKAPAQKSSANSSAHLTKDQITAFYNDPQNKINFAMDSLFREDQAQFALLLLLNNTLNATQLKSFAQYVGRQANNAQLTLFVNGLYGMFTPDQQKAFAKQIPAFKNDNGNEVAYLIAQVLAAVPGSLFLEKKRIFDTCDLEDQLKLMQAYGSKDQIERFANFVNLAQDPKNIFAASLQDRNTFKETLNDKLSYDQKNELLAHESAFKTLGDFTSYYYPFMALSCLEQFLADGFFNIVSPTKKMAFFKLYAHSDILEEFIDNMFDNAGEHLQESFAEECLIVAAQKQSITNMSGYALGSAVLTANQVLQQDIAQGALGGVVPIYGFEDHFEDYLTRNFSPTIIKEATVAGGSVSEVFADQSAASQTKALAIGVLKTKGASVSDGSDSINSATAEQTSGAHNINYPAFGVYIYECMNTPFAKELIKLTQAQALDYIVFFDEDLNQVPLQVPAPNRNNFSFPDYILNPAIAYWASLICYIGNGSGPLDEFMGRYQDSSGTVQTFFPLYTLTGQLVYVEGAASAMENVIAGINKNQAGSTVNVVSLYNQILTVAKAEVLTYQTGPFYPPYNLHEPDAKMWMSAPAANGSATPSNVVGYVGMPPYPMPLSLGANALGATDYLVPFVKEGGNSISVQLPNPYVEMFVSLVTDITFVVQVDGKTGQAAFVPSNFAYSQYNPTAGYNPNLEIAGSKNGGVWLNNLAKAGVTIPAALKADIAKQREAWITYISQDLKDPAYKAQLTIPFGVKYSLSIATADDYKNGNYMYRCIPSPSGVKDDLFVMSAQATLPNSSVGLRANVVGEGKNLQPYIVSMATGYMYDSNGAGVKDKNGKPVVMDFGTLLSLVATNQRAGGGKGLPDATSKHLAQINKIGIQQGLIKQGPYEFGSLLLYLYKIDIDNNNYVYFATDSSGIPHDYFVVVQSTKPPFIFGGQIDAQTQDMVSLITGQLYTRNGVAGVWPDITTLLSSVQNSMHISPTDLAQINKINALFIATQKNEAVQKSQVAAQEAAAKATITEDISNIAANIVGLPYLPSPYDSLVQDTATKKYYRVTPDANGKPLLIFDFNATSQAQDSGIGAIFQANGTLMTTMKGIHLAGMRQQYGVHVDPKNGAQTLTIPHIVGNMNLYGNDLTIKPGSSGTALLHSSDSQFPTPGISSVKSGSKTYDFYYHTFLAVYFAYVADSATGEKYYISVDDGTAYNLDGSARIMHHQVVRDAQGNAIIIAQDSAGYLSVLAADPNKKSTTFGKYINFINPVQPEQISVESDSKAGNWAVNGLAGVTGQVDGNATTMYVLQEFPKQYGSMVFNSAAQTYELYDASGANKTVFTLDSKSQVQYLSYIPVDTNGQIQTKSVSDLMQSACLIMSTDATPVTLEVIFNGIVYKPASAGSSTFTSAGGDSISVQAVSANPDCAAYAVITQGAKKYIYSYAYQILSSDDFADLQHNIWNMNTAMSSTMKAVLCENMHEKGLKQVTTSLVKGIPANRILAVQQAISGMQFDAISGKYFAPIKAADYGYFGQAGFVDIENGCLYDSAGLSYGYSITLQDYVALLDKLGVMVIYNSNTKKYDIVYRTAQAVSQQTASLPEASGNGGAVKSA